LQRLRKSWMNPRVAFKRTLKWSLKILFKRILRLKPGDTFQKNTQVEAWRWFSKEYLGGAYRGFENSSYKSLWKLQKIKNNIVGACVNGNPTSVGTKYNSRLWVNQYKLCEYFILFYYFWFFVFIFSFRKHILQYYILI